MINTEIIYGILKQIPDPSTGINIVEKRMIDKMDIKDNNVNIQLSISEKTGAEQRVALMQKIESAIKADVPEAKVHMHFVTSKSNPTEHLSPLPQVKNIIAVASGKGGVGKSTIAVNLALALKDKGLKVGLLDADLYGPSIPTMFGLQGQRPKIEMLYGKHKMIPIEKYGIHLMSVGFVVEPAQAVVLRGPRLAGLLKQFVEECIWPRLDYLIIDLPPGTGDVQLTLVQTLPLTGAVMVTTPQQVAVDDALKAMNMFMISNINVPILGVVENMSWFTPAELPDNKYFLFGQGGGEKLAQLGQTNVLAQIPLVQAVREAGDAGKPIAIDKKNTQIQHFSDFADALIQAVRLRNEQKDPTQIVQITRN